MLKKELRTLFNFVFGKEKKQYEKFRFSGAGSLNSIMNISYSNTQNIFNIDIIRSCVRPVTSATSRSELSLISSKNDITLQNIKNILNKPNIFMSKSEFLEKISFQLNINNNAFVYIRRNEKGLVTGLFPVPYSSVEMIEYKEAKTEEEMYFLKFSFLTGLYVTIPYTHCIHIRKDFCNNDIFGDENISPLIQALDILNSTDEATVKSAKTSGIINWLLKFKTQMRNEDKLIKVEDFVNNYLSYSSSMGVAATDNSMDIELLDGTKTQSLQKFSPEQNSAVQRIQNYFNVSKDIIQNTASEQIWNCFYNQVVEPQLMKIEQAFTHKLLTQKQINEGAKITLTNSRLHMSDFSKRTTMLTSLMPFGILTINEARNILDLSEVEGGDIRLQSLNYMDSSGVTAYKMKSSKSEEYQKKKIELKQLEEELEQEGVDKIDD